MNPSSNSSRTIYLFSPFFYPEAISTGRYNTFLAESLVKRGHEVHVIASHPIFPNWRVTHTDASLEGMVIHRGGSRNIYPKSSLLRRIILESWFSLHSLLFWFSLLLTHRLRRSSSVVLAIFPPSLFFSFLSLFIPSTIRRVGIVHDLQSVYISRKGLIHRLIAFAIHTVESRGFNSCQHLVFLSHSMMLKAIDCYSIDPRICTVSHPFVTLPTTNYPSRAVDLALGSNYHNVIYSGALGDKQEPDRLLAFLVALQHTDPLIKCHIFSAGPHFDRLRLEATRLDVSFHDLVPSSELPALYARSFVQIIPQSFGTGDGSLPSKLPNLLAAGVPIFAICEPGSELGSLVSTFRAGAVSHHWDPLTLVSDFLASWSCFTHETHFQRRSRLKDQVSTTFGIESVIDHIISNPA